MNKVFRNLAIAAGTIAAAVVTGEILDDLDLDILLDDAPDDIVPDTEIANTYMEDFSDSYHSDYSEGCASEYHPSFIGKERTIKLQSAGGGQSITVEVEKVNGSNNTFNVSHGDKSIRVSGNDNIVRIDGIKYKLPNLK